MQSLSLSSPTHPLSVSLSLSLSRCICVQSPDSHDRVRSDAFKFLQQRSWEARAIVELLDRLDAGMSRCKCDLQHLHGCLALTVPLLPETTGWRVVLPRAALLLTGWRYVLMRAALLLMTAHRQRGKRGQGGAGARVRCNAEQGRHAARRFERPRNHLAGAPLFDSGAKAQQWAASFSWLLRHTPCAKRSLATARRAKTSDKKCTSQVQNSLVPPKNAPLPESWHEQACLHLGLTGSVRLVCFFHPLVLPRSFPHLRAVLENTHQRRLSLAAFRRATGSCAKPHALFDMHRAQANLSSRSHPVAHTRLVFRAVLCWTRIGSWPVAAGPRA